MDDYSQLTEKTRYEFIDSESIHVICNALRAKPDDVVNITALKKGMTNRSFLFDCKDKRYIMRIPGEGTDQLINRRQESEVYKKIAGKGISDYIVYINSENGYKITGFLEDVKLYILHQG